MTKKTQYSFKKNIFGAIRVAVEVILAGLVVYATGNPQWIALVPALEFAYGFIKNYEWSK